MEGYRCFWQQVLPMVEIGFTARARRKVSKSAICPPYIYI
jgi:hypothetical protein